MSAPGETARPACGPWVRRRPRSAVAVDAAIVRRVADRRADVAARLDAGEAAASAAPTAGRAAGRAAMVPRIVGGAVDLVEALIVGEHPRHVGLAEKSHTGIDHALGDQRVLLGLVVLEDRRAPGRRIARDVERLLDGHRHAVQGPQLLAGLDRLVGCLGALARARDVAGDDGVELGIIGFDAPQVEIEQLEATDLLLPDGRSELLGGPERRALVIGLLTRRRAAARSCGIPAPAAWRTGCSCSRHTAGR